MWNTLRSRLTYSNVMVTVLAFIVLGGGGAYALAGRNTVFSDDIAPGNVRASDIRDIAFHNLNLINGWVPHDTGASPGVAKDGFGVVHLRGAMKRPTGSSTSPFRLPSGFRPARTLTIPIDSCSTIYARILIENTGAVTLQGDGPSLACRTSLEGVAFKATG
jgi:hypothetical protein